MKKLIIAVVAALIINLAGMYANYRSFVKTNHLICSFKTYGGEFMGESGFGLRASHHYAMTADGKDLHGIRFSPINFIVFMLVATAVTYTVTRIIFKIKSR